MNSVKDRNGKAIHAGDIVNHPMQDGIIVENVSGWGDVVNGIVKRDGYCVDWSNMRACDLEVVNA